MAIKLGPDRVTRQTRDAPQCKGVLHSCVLLSALLILPAGHDGCVNACSFTQEGNLLITGSDDLQVIAWDWQTGKDLRVSCMCTLRRCVAAVLYAMYVFVPQCSLLAQWKIVAMLVCHVCRQGGLEAAVRS